MSKHAIHRLAELGQSVWYDFIRRGLIVTGELKRLIEEDRLAGMTSNPTIFQKAISEGGRYDEQIREAAARGRSPVEIFDELAVRDIQDACDLFGPLYERTSGGDGFVSIEVAPGLAYETEGSVAEARRLWKEVARPNLLVKIPGTGPGLPAIQKCLTEGININITLLFSVERYLEVVEAYFAALEARAGAGQPVDRIASVASFFVSRVDTKTDKYLDEAIAKASEEKTMAAARELQGKIAIANAKIAYEKFEERFRGPRWEALSARGARVQRPLWASTSTKNPAYPDTYYVEALVGPHTVDTVPPETFMAYKDHGDPAVRVTRDLDRAHAQLRRLEELGLSLVRITQELEEEGVKAFSDSYDKLLKGVGEKKEALRVA